MTYRILAYHTVGRYPDLLPSGIGTSPEEFARQLDWLASSGFRVVPLDSVLETLASGARPPERDVAITFDDGYVDCLTHAVPALRERGLPATFFVAAGLLGQPMPLGSTSLPLMSPDQLAELAATPGITIGSHGSMHVSLSGLSDSKLVDEISGSRTLLASITRRPVRWISYPFGAHDATVAAAARAAGYDDALAVWTRNEGPFSRLRIPVHTHDGPWRFALKLSKLYFPLKRCAKW